MLRTWRRSTALFSDFNTLQFSSVMALVVFVLLLIFMTEGRPHRSVAADPPKVLHPISLPGASRRDAVKITITRDGKVWVGIDALYDLAELPGKVKHQLNNAEVERKVYITADAQTRWRTVKSVLQGVRDAGVVRVAFLTR
jgi:biopolymer transport protein ExbD/biopolymer transport protein TolR